jgi:hypothetical protein
MVGLQQRLPRDILMIEATTYVTRSDISQVLSFPSQPQATNNLHLASVGSLISPVDLYALQRANPTITCGGRK